MPELGRYSLLRRIGVGGMRQQLVGVPLPIVRIEYRIVIACGAGLVVVWIPGGNAESSVAIAKRLAEGGRGVVERVTTLPPAATPGGPR